jgi:hypothetical protein
MGDGGSGMLRFGDFEFDSVAGKLFREDRLVRIQRRALKSPVKIPSSPERSPLRASSLSRP